MKTSPSFWRKPAVMGLLGAVLCVLCPYLSAAPVSDWVGQLSGTTANLWSVAARVDGTTGLVTGVAVGERGVIVTSVDGGASWTRSESGTIAWLTSVAYVDAVKKFFAVGEGGVILSSSDATTWVREISPTSIRLNSVSAGASSGQVQAFGEAGTGVLTRGIDGVWTQNAVDFGGRWLRGCSGNYAVGQGGAIFATNSSGWSPVPSATVLDLESVVFGPISGGITYSTIAVGANGTIVQKTLESEFMPRASGTTERLNAICFKTGGGTVLITNAYRPVFSEFFVVGTGGTILRSADGAKWQADASPTAQNLHAVCSAGSAVLAVGDGGTILKIGGAGLAPTITRQPTMGYDEAGQAYLDGEAVGSGVLTYQWVQLTAGAPYPVGFDHPRQSAAKSLTPAGSPATAVYQLLVANAFGMVWSQTVAPNRLHNLSTRARVGAGENSLISGFALAGFLPKLERRVLVRAVGPTLANFGISSALRAPKLTVFSGSTPIATNTGWQTNSDPAALVGAARAVGAFSLAANSNDSALIVSLPPGSYTAQIESADGSAGIALAEIYDLEAPTLTRLANVSARAQVLAGEGVLIGGLVIDGSIKKKVLLRAAGPALSAFGVNGVLTKPKLTLFRGDAMIATATAWGAAENAAALAAAAKTIGAFAFAEGSADAALLLELEPGAYTLQVSGADGGTGVALVEAYELP